MMNLLYIRDIAGPGQRLTRGQMLRELGERGRKIDAQKSRMLQLPPLQKGEADRLIKQYIQANGVTKCPPRFAEVTNSSVTVHEFNRALDELATLVNKPKPHGKRKRRG